jgi:hypothetical protein
MLARQVWEQMAHPSARRVAQKLRQAGRPVSHETINRWRSRGWRPLEREQHPIDRAWAALDDAVPVLTGDPLTTAESFAGASVDPESLDDLSDAELLRMATRRLAMAEIFVANAMLRQDPTLVVKRVGELGILLRALAECALAVATGFVQADKMGATEPNPAKEEDRQ